jgi:hypothetical protein
MTVRRGVFILTVILMVLVLQPKADAACNFAASLPDNRVNGPFFIVSGTDLTFDFGVTAGRSYSVEALDATGLLTFTINVNTFFCPTTDLTSLVDTTTTDPTSGTISTCCFLRKSFTAAASGFVEMRVTTTDATGGNILVSASETTLFNPRWSTFSGFFTSYGFTNTTGKVIHGELTIRNGAGTVVATHAFTTPAGGVSFTDTNQLAIAKDSAGSAIFTHDGPPGAILADGFIANFSVSPPAIQPVKFDARQTAH